MYAPPRRAAPVARPPFAAALPTQPTQPTQPSQPPQRTDVPHPPRHTQHNHNHNATHHRQAKDFIHSGRQAETETERGTYDRQATYFMASDCKYPHTHITHTIQHTTQRAKVRRQGSVVRIEEGRAKVSDSVSECSAMRVCVCVLSQDANHHHHHHQPADRQTGGRVPTEAERKSPARTQRTHRTVAPVYLSHLSRNSSTHTPQPHTRIEKYYYMSSSPSPPPSQQPASRHKEKSALVFAAGLPACLRVPTHKRTTLMPFIHLTNGRKRSAKNTRHAVTKESTSRPSTIQAKPSQAKPHTHSTQIPSRRPANTTNGTRHQHNTQQHPRLEVSRDSQPLKGSLVTEVGSDHHHLNALANEGVRVYLLPCIAVVGWCLLFSRSVTHRRWTPPRSTSVWCWASSSRSPSSPSPSSSSPPTDTTPASPRLVPRSPHSSESGASSPPRWPTHRCRHPSRQPARPPLSTHTEA